MGLPGQPGQPGGRVSPDPEKYLHCDLNQIHLPISKDPTCQYLTIKYLEHCNVISNGQHSTMITVFKTIW